MSHKPLNFVPNDATLLASAIAALEKEIAPRLLDEDLQGQGNEIRFKLRLVINALKMLERSQFFSAEPVNDPRKSDSTSASKEIEPSATFKPDAEAISNIEALKDQLALQLRVSNPKWLDNPF